MISDGRQFVPYEKNEASFSRHGENMKRFRLGHPRVQVKPSGKSSLDWLRVLPSYRAKPHRDARN